MENIWKTSLDFKKLWLGHIVDKETDGFTCYSHISVKP